MYEFQDEKVRIQMEYDKLLQKYQVQLAALYTIPLGLFFSLISLFGIDRLNENTVAIAFITLAIAYIIIKDWLSDTENKMEQLKREMTQIEVVLLVDKSEKLLKHSNKKKQS